MYYSDSATVVLRNKQSFDSGVSPSSVVVADFNNDNRLDIVVTNYDSNTTNVLLGYGNGSFATQTTFDTGIGPVCMAFGDFNNDTRLDIVVTNYDSNTISVLRGYGKGSFRGKKNISR